MQVKTFFSNNFGDLPLNRYLYEKITGKQADCTPLSSFSEEYHYLLCGSIMNKATNKSVVWGSGFIQQNSTCKQPQRVYAVRGKLTRQRLVDLKIDVPYIFGDPCLMLPKFYNPKIEKVHEIGLIPHYSDYDTVKEFKNIHVIDVCQPVEKVIDEVLSCKKIFSSSLHGLILADTYKIPNLWIGINNLIQGIGFKYLDYYSITNRNPVARLQLNPRMKLSEYTKYCKKSKITVDLDKFWEVCPLRRENEPTVG